MATMARIEIIVLFQKVDLFSLCNADQLIQLASISHECELREEEVVYRRGDPSDSLYCVVDGKVELRTGEGTRRLVGPDERFGVMDILSGRPRTADAVAVSDTRAVKIEAEDFFDLLSNNIDIVKVLFRQLARQSEPLAGPEV
ncbi:MAG: Crp/Fnr family transcriptional regulator [Acidobacteriota bacterium]